MIKELKVMCSFSQNEQILNIFLLNVSGVF